MKSPERVPLSRRTADLLEDQIRSGRWQKKLPGYRVLSQGMSVSRRTMDTALQILTRRKIILPAEGKTARKIHPNILAEASHRPERKSLLIFLADTYQKQEFSTRHILEKVAVSLTRKGWDVNFESNSEYANGTPGAVLERMVSNRGDHRWLLVKPKFPIVKWLMERNIRIICLGGVSQNLRPPLIAMGIGNLLHDSTKKLLDLGHRRICALTNFISENDHKILSLRMQQATAGFNIPFHPAFNLPIIKANDPAQFWNTLDHLFTLSKPSALIATEARHLITIYSFCLHKGLQIPRDLSLILLYETEHKDWFHPLPAYYECPINKFVVQIMRWIENYPTKELPPTIVQPKFLPGGSLKQLG